MSPGYTVTTETRGEVEIFLLREADIASAAIVPAWGNNCFILQVHEPVLESVAFEECHTHPTSYGIPILFSWRGVESSLIVLLPGETRHFLVSIATHRAGS